MTPKLFPVPRHLAYLGGETKIPDALDYSVADSQLADVAAFFAKERNLPPSAEGPGFLRFEKNPELAEHEEAHRIVVEADGILIQASTPAGAPGSPWHQDEHPIPTRDRSLCGIWIALSDTTTENGALWVVRDSHKPGIIYDRKPHALPAVDSMPQAV